jgi:imidazoleglycerol-phosphate dehydratase/histidinol-phosphatase
MAKKILFIDRDGTIIVEPPIDFQIDSYEKLAFLPDSITYLQKIATELDYAFVMVTNQDGLGTTVFPEPTFWGAHNLMLQILESQGITFHKIHIDKSFPQENAPTRKPKTGMLEEYFVESWDLKNSFTIGDRWTDIHLAENLGCKGILIGQGGGEKAGENALILQANTWKDIYDFLKHPPRTATMHRVTKETDIFVAVNLDGSGKTDMHTGLGFFDHMLDQLGKHSFCDITIKVNGDLHIDEHHTIEDTALALGECFLKALGDKRGIERYGYALPMDDCLAQAALDFGGRPWLVWDVKFKREKIGDMPTEMFYHFFKSFSDTSKSNLNIIAKGANEHHKIEAIFKAVAKSIKQAVKRDAVNNQLPTTKGVL